MSDGPYRSLPMSRSWKRFAKFAQNTNFGGDDVCGAALDALKKEWRKGVPAALAASAREIFLAPQSGLFVSHRVEDAQALYALATGHGFGKLFVDHVVNAIQEGRNGDSGLVEATKRVLVAYEARVFRQIEEIYSRKAESSVTRLVCRRARKALDAIDHSALARQLCGLDSPVARRASVKHKGLDEGVPL